MAEHINLTQQMEEHLPADILSLLRAVARIADARTEALYLVGGAVRDLLLSHSVVDLDLVVEGDAPLLARRFAESTEGQVLTHPRFGTAKLKWGDSSLDLATARSETYERPGALPRVRAGSIQTDLFRRDFSINAMAIRLNAAHFGQLTDPYQGRSDLQHRLIRILHDKSFIDDATRILRALRYEQRLSFRLEQGTEKMLRQDVAMLDTVSGDRLRHELELILREDSPEKVLHRMDELGVLHQLHPSLAGDGWLAERFERARHSHTGARPEPELYLALLAYRLNHEETQNLIHRLKVSSKAATIVRSALQLRVSLPALMKPDLQPSSIYHLLEDHPAEAVQVVAVATDSPTIRQRLSHYLTTLRYVKSMLDGEALIRMGVEPGPRLGEMLRALRDARLDGEIRTKEEEEALVHQWVAETNE